MIIVLLLVVLLLLVLLFPLVRASALPRVLFRFLSKLLVNVDAAVAAASAGTTCR